MAEMLKRLAVFMDYDNQKVDPTALLNMLRERGKVVLRRAYADWVASQAYRSVVTRAGFDLIDCAKIGASHKNSADVRMTLDCLETCYEQPQIESFVIVTGDADFVPLVNKLRMKGRETIVIARLGGAAGLLRQACDEFIPADRLERLGQFEEESSMDHSGALRLYKRALVAITRAGKDPDKVERGMMKQAMLQLEPTFDEDDLGFKSFTDFSKWAAAQLYQPKPQPISTQGPASTAAYQLKPSVVVKMPSNFVTRIYNEALKQGPIPVTPSGLEQALRQIQPDLLQRYGIETVSALSDYAVEQGLWQIENGVVRMPPEHRINITLRSMYNDHDTETRRKILEALVSTVDAWAEDASTMTVNEVRKRMRQPLIGQVAGNDIDGLLKCARVGGAFLSIEGTPLSSYGLPFKLGGDLEYLETKSLEGCLLRLVGGSGLSVDEVPAVASVLVGKEGTGKIASMLGLLVDQGKIVKEGDRWTRAVSESTETTSVGSSG